MPTPLEKPALIAIHYQNDILHPDSKFHVGVDLLSNRRASVVDAAKRLLQGARAHKIPIIHARIAFRENHKDLIANCALFDKVEAAAALLDESWGADFYEGLAPLPEETVVTHIRNNAFFGTELQPLIAKLGGTRLIFAGVATNYSVEHTARHAVDMGYHVSIVSDACTTGDPELHEASLRTMALLADIKTVDQIIAEFAINRSRQ